MKTWNSLNAFGLIVVVGLAAAGSSWGKSPAYDEFEKNLVFDRVPLQNQAGVMTSYADVLEKARPAVVSIFTTKEVDMRGMDPYLDNPLFKYFFGVPDGEDPENPRERNPKGPKQQGLGSGVIVTRDGYVLTNYHVIEGADEIKVALPKRQQAYTAEVIGTDEATDVAILKIDAKGLTAATLADSAKTRVGDVVLAIGNPFELEQTVTMGIVSALGRRDFNIVDYANFIQTDAPINPGNSGGALIDAQGRVVGINTAIQGGGGLGMAMGNIGIGFAIPVNMALDIVKRIFEGDGKVSRGFLGVRLAPMDADWAEALGRPDYSGALVDEVVEEIDGVKTPAARAGFIHDDLVVEFQGEKVVSANQLRLDIGDTPPGEEVTFKVIRDGKEKILTTTLELLDRDKLAEQAGGAGEPGKTDDAKGDFIDGVEIADLTPRLRGMLGFDEDMKGVLVQRVAPYSAAAEGGLTTGDLIMEVNRTPVNSVADAIRERAGFKGNVMILRVYSPTRNASNSIIIRLK